MPESNGAKPEGGFQERLERPEKAADLTYPEVTEIKERKRLIERQEEVAADAQKMLAIVKSEYQQHLKRLVETKGLNTNDSHFVDTDSGVILRTARYVEPTLVETAPVEAPVAVEE